jgi:hypothetical protein
MRWRRWRRDRLQEVPPMPFLYVKIPVDPHAADRLHRREYALDEALKSAGVGSVLGWGDSLGDEAPVGSRAVAYTRIDVDVTDLAAARSVLRTTLPTLNAGDGTQIHYTIGHTRLEDRYRAGGWQLDLVPIEPAHTR